MNKNEIADKFLSAAIEKGADKAQCVVSHNIITEIYYEQGKISLLRTLVNNTVTIKVIKDQKKGVVSQNNFDTPDKAVEEALLAAEHAKEDPAEDICDEVNTKTFTSGPLEPNEEAMYNGLVKFINQTKNRFPTISFDSISVEHVLTSHLYKNTNNVSMEETRGVYVFSPMFMSISGEKTSSFNSSLTIFKDPETNFMSLGITEKTLEETEKQANTKTIDGKFKGSLIIAPQCLDDIISTIEGNFLSDSVLINNTSLFKDKLNQQVAAKNVTIYSTPLNSQLASGYNITGDGYAAADMPLIENGILKNFVLSRYGAQRTGKARSANDGGYYVMTAGEKTIEEIIKNTEKGILLTRFSGGEPGVDGDITGVAKNSFLIENGKITDALSEAMISANLAEMMMNISEISSQTFSNGTFILPYVKVEGVTISGK